VLPDLVIVLHKRAKGSLRNCTGNVAKRDRKRVCRPCKESCHISEGKRASVLAGVVVEEFASFPANLNGVVTTKITHRIRQYIGGIRSTLRKTGRSAEV